MKRFVFYFISLVVMLTSCGKVFHVPVMYVAITDEEEKARYEALQQVYVLIKKPSTLASLDFEKTGGDITVGNRLSAFNARLFAGEIDQELSRIGGSVLAYRVIDAQTKTDPFTVPLSPSGRLILSGDGYDVRHRTIEKEKQVKDAQGNNTARIYKETEYNASMNVHCTLIAGSEGQVLFSKVFPVELKHTYTSDPSENHEREIVNSLIKNTAQKIVFSLSPKVYTRFRPIYRNKDHEDSVQAYKLARKNKWKEAEKIWGRRIEAGEHDWRDTINMGVACEHQRAYQEALVYYRRSQEESKDQQEAQRIVWDEIYRDISESLLRQEMRSTGASQWFGHRLAVLPFSDETVSIDGPVMLRQFVHETLTRGGYNTVPLDEVDEMLRNHGFSQGGQLRVIAPEKVSSWLKADWLLYGHIADFNKTNIGIYVKKSIEGTLTFWERENKREFWSSHQSVKVHSIPTAINKGGILTHFLKNLGESWIESMKDKPLAEESADFVIKNMEQFPLKPFP